MNTIEKIKHLIEHDTSMDKRHNNSNKCILVYPTKKFHRHGTSLKDDIQMAMGHIQGESTRGARQYAHIRRGQSHT